MKKTVRVNVIDARTPIGGQRDETITYVGNTHVHQASEEEAPRLIDGTLGAESLEAISKIISATIERIQNAEPDFEYTGASVDTIFTIQSEQPAAMLVSYRIPFRRKSSKLN